jgi:hypothetical protein
VRVVYAWPKKSGCPDFWTAGSAGSHRSELYRRKHISHTMDVKWLIVSNALTSILSCFDEAIDEASKGNIDIFTLINSGVDLRSNGHRNKFYVKIVEQRAVVLGPRDHACDATETFECQIDSGLGFNGGFSWGFGLHHHSCANTLRCELISMAYVD